MAIKETTDPTKIWPSRSLASVVNNSGSLIIDAPTITGNERRNAKTAVAIGFGQSLALIVTPNLLIPAKSARL